MKVETVKIKPSTASQGDYVVINKSDYDPAKHELYEEKPKRRSVKRDANR